jgi:hypothetical protein
VITVPRRDIYVFHSPSLRALKFGSSYSWQVRLDQLRRRHAPDLRLVAVVTGDDPQQVIAIENNIHYRLSGHSIHVPGLRCTSLEWYPDDNRVCLQIISHFLRDEDQRVTTITPWMAVKPWHMAVVIEAMDWMHPVAEAA